MVTLGGIWRSVKTTKNFWEVFPLKFGRKKRIILFRNGITAEVDWTKYCSLRDWFEKLRKESIKIKWTDGKYRVFADQPKLACGAISLKQLQNAIEFFHFTFRLYSSGWEVKQTDEEFFNIKKGNENYIISRSKNNTVVMTSTECNLAGPLDSLRIFFEECNFYKCDCRGRVVLDVGGFCGETAVYFRKLGAEKIVIYEPVLAHLEFIQENVKLNNIKAEIHAQGIGKEDGTITVPYDCINPEFGRVNQGKQELTVSIRNIKDVISECEANVAKFDCEGAEECLTVVDDDILRKIDFYLIETHNRETERAITEKFIRAGFKMSRSPEKITAGVYVLCFEKADH
jgi:FkbM family methyltransferase